MSNVCDNMVCGEKLECFFVFFKKTGATHLRRCYPFTTLDRSVSQQHHTKLLWKAYLEIERMDQHAVKTNILKNILIHV